MQTQQYYALSREIKNRGATAPVSTASDSQKCGYDDLSAARGIILSVIFGLLSWATIIIGVWAVLR